jgi:hypothetical protein
MCRRPSSTDQRLTVLKIVQSGYLLQDLGAVPCVLSTTVAASNTYAAVQQGESITRTYVVRNAEVCMLTAADSAVQNGQLDQLQTGVCAGVVWRLQFHKLPSLGCVNSGQRGFQCQAYKFSAATFPGE